MSGGTFSLSREVFDHPIVGIKHPERFAAWCWMLSQARWKDGRHKGVDLKRGEFSHSVRFMAEAVGMSKSAFDRFLTRLKTGTQGGPMIETATGTGQLVISICNYDKYQGGASITGTADGTASGTPTGTQAGQQRDKLEEGEIRGKKEKNPQTPLKVLCEILPRDLAEEFIAHRRKKSKPLNTERMARGVVRHLAEIEAAGLNPSDAIIKAMEEGWQTVKLEYLQNRRVPSQKTGGKNERVAAAMADAKRSKGRTEAGPGMADGACDVVPGPLLPAGRDRNGIQDEDGGLARGSGGPAPSGYRDGDQGPPSVIGSCAPDFWGNPGIGEVVPFAVRAGR